MTQTKLSTMSVYEKYNTCIKLCFAVITLFVVISSIAMAEIEKAAENKAFYQSQLDQSVINATTKRIATCNDDIIKGWCAKYNMRKIEFEKGNN